MSDISAVVCTYQGDNVKYLEQSLQSLLNQTRPPDELLIVEDGRLTDSLYAALDDIETEALLPVNRVRLPENRGHGMARRVAILEANHDLVAIHDADDLAVEHRLEWSEAKIAESGADLVGGYIEEFETDPENPHAVRKVPCNPAKIRRMALLRSPINHTTVLARREAILDAGNYRPVGQMEDYELWARMLVDGCKIVNIPRVLAKVRTGREMYERRGGLDNLREEIRLQQHLQDVGFVSRRRAFFNLVVRGVPKLLPNALRRQLYERVFRDKIV